MPLRSFHPGQTFLSASHRTSAMSPELHWPAIAFRLVLTVLGGGLLGADRSRTGHPAGLRTTLLVAMAASVSMIQMNLLLPTNGKPADSYAVMDLMRLPLGILTGVGFIGAGAIVRKGDLVLGITTAATLWFATVVGLCMGGGQIILGSTATVLGYLVLTALRWAEHRIGLYQPATLTLVTAQHNIDLAGLRPRLEAARFRVRAISVEYSPHDQRQNIRCEVRWPSPHGAADLPAIFEELERTPGLIQLAWHTEPGISPEGSETSG
jgi:putative Mg2+ transporter-C (MgtC) family protein